MANEHCGTHFSRVLSTYFSFVTFSRVLSTYFSFVTVVRPAREYRRSVVSKMQSRLFVNKVKTTTRRSTSEFAKKKRKANGKRHSESNKTKKINSFGENDSYAYVLYYLKTSREIWTTWGHWSTECSRFLVDVPKMTECIKYRVFDAHSVSISFRVFGALTRNVYLNALFFFFFVRSPSYLSGKTNNRWNDSALNRHYFQT